MLLETERLVLRPLQSGDVDDIFPYHSDPDSVRYIPWDVRDRDSVISWLERAEQFTSFRPAEPGLLLAMVEKASGRVIGQLNTKLVDEPNKTANIGYISHPSFRGQGLVHEALTALIEHIFKCEQVHRVITDIDVRNHPSVRVVERLGFRREATFIENDYLKGEWCSMHLYALLSREWRSN